jgi:drug/metabolite transporter (DMT)-like permease
MDTKIPSSDSSYGLGLIVLLVAQVLSAFMGVWIQDTYAQYGNHWDENLFYSHLFSLPLFLPLQPLLASQYKRLLDSPPLLLSPNIAALVPLPAQQLLAKLPRSIFNLALNSATQLACITGVNLLGAKSSAVTVTIVLNVRKLVSFMLSVWIFGNTLSGRMVVGAVLVFGAGALYGWETTVGIKTRKKEADMRAANGVNGLAKKGL